MEYVNLSECQLGENHLLCIAKGFNVGNKFKKLLLSGNLASDGSLGAFGEAIKLSRCNL